MASSIDPVTLDVIENALKNARDEMDAVLYRTAMSPTIREQHDEFPMITDPAGRMVVGQFGSYLAEMTANLNEQIKRGDVLLTSDPYLCAGAISHVNDWLVAVPIFYSGDLIGWASMFGHQIDVGGPTPGSVPTGARNIFGEGIKVPPVKIYREGQPNVDVLEVILNNVRAPEIDRGDLLATIAGCNAAVKRITELCDRFGKDTYLCAIDALMARTREAMRRLVLKYVPETPRTFDDYVDDDGLGNGPYRLSLKVWREGERAIFDWSETAPQALGPINFLLHPGMLKMFIGAYLIMAYDPDILFNEGFYDIFDVRLPPGSILSPVYPAALGCRTHTLGRLFDVLGGALAKCTPEFAIAAGYGTSPYMLYSGYLEESGEFFYLMEICFGGIPGRPKGDGLDGHAWWPRFANIPTEYLESYYPVRIESYRSVPDTGGAGFHRGGNAVEKVYAFLSAGHVSIHDDRWLTRPWGIAGGRPGARSKKILRRADGTEEILPSKCDGVEVRAGDQLVYQTAGSGGWGSPSARPAHLVERDVRRGLVTSSGAEHEYREGGTASSGPVTIEGEVMFDSGAGIIEALDRCMQETGRPAPRAPRELPWVAARADMPVPSRHWAEAIAPTREGADLESLGAPEPLPRVDEYRVVFDEPNGPIRGHQSADECAGKRGVDRSVGATSARAAQVDDRLEASVPPDYPLTLRAWVRRVTKTQDSG